MIKAIAVDDEPLALKVIEKFCEKLDFITLEKTFNKPGEALKYVNKFPIDLLFLDINMPSINGIEFYICGLVSPVSNIVCIHSLFSLKYEL